MEDESCITNSQYMLTDREIAIWQRLLHGRFPQIDGFMSTTLGPIGQFDVMRQEFVQVLFTGSCHWVCVSNNGMSPGSVNLFDSLSGRNIAKSVKKQLALLLHQEDHEKIHVHIQPVQRQTNASDCGVFALAFATAICFGYQPSHCRFDIDKMRSHLWECVKTNHVEMFPCKRICRKEKPVIVTFSIYCECRMIYDISEDKMACYEVCKKWTPQVFAHTCQSIYKEKC